VVKAMARLFAEMGEAYVELIASGQDTPLRPLPADSAIAAFASGICRMKILHVERNSERSCKLRVQGGSRVHPLLGRAAWDRGSRRQARWGGGKQSRSLTARGAPGRQRRRWLSGEGFKLDLDGSGALGVPHE